MFDQAAAQDAARQILADAPRIEGGGGTELVISIRALVDAIVAAGNPDALALPAYDGQIAPDAWYRIEAPTDTNPGATMTALAHPDAVLLTVHNGQGDQVVSSLIGPSFVWHLGLALCSAAQEARKRSEAQA